MLQEFNPNQKVNLAKKGQFDLSANLSWWRTWLVLGGLIRTCDLLNK